MADAGKSTSFSTFSPKATPDEVVIKVPDLDNGGVKNPAFKVGELTYLILRDLNPPFGPLVFNKATITSRKFVKLFRLDFLSAACQTNIVTIIYYIIFFQSHQKSKCGTAYKQV